MQANPRDRQASVPIVALFAVLSAMSLVIGAVATYSWLAHDEPTRFETCRNPQTGASMTCTTGDEAWRDAALTTLPSALRRAGAAAYGIWLRRAAARDAQVS